MRKFICSAIVLFLIVSHVHAQKSWRVNNVPGINADFTTLAAAVAAASDGDTIYLESSPNSYGGATITKRLVIFGTGYFLSSVNEKTQWNKDEARITGSLTFNAGSTGSVLSGIVTGGYININVGGIVLERNYLHGLQIAPAANSNADTCIFRQNYFNGSVSAGAATGSAANLLFHNNIFRSSVDFRNALDNFTAYFINNNFIYYNTIHTGGCIFQNNIFDSPNFGPYLAGNAFYNNIVNNTSIPAGNNNQLSVNLDNVYVNYNNANPSPSEGFSEDGKYQLKPGSPATGAGVLNGETVDCGAFGGPAPYVLSGMPPIPSIYRLVVPQQVNSGISTMTISISSASH
ncbi:MAG: hypothetical protein J5I50_09120 [Chitinophagaceae bacterium]|nr:hypothetical protein [Chitinophagaceae bacterium]